MMMTRILSCIPQFSDRDFVRESSFFEPIGIKQGLVSHTLWQSDGTIVGVLYLSTKFSLPLFLNEIIRFNAKKDFLNITRLLKLLVITHGSNKTR